MLALVHVILVLTRRSRWQFWIVGLAAGLMAGLMLSGIVYFGLAIYRILAS